MFGHLVSSEEHQESHPIARASNDWGVFLVICWAFALLAAVLFGVVR